MSQAQHGTHQNTNQGLFLVPKTEIMTECKITTVLLGIVPLVGLQIVSWRIRQANMEKKVG